MALWLSLGEPRAGADAARRRKRPRSSSGSPPLQLEAPPPSAGEEPAVLAPVVVTAPPPVYVVVGADHPRQGLRARPQGRPADVLRYVPGLIMSQHAGGGKSEQYILRGFDADHGTDVALFVDGMPVNLRSHAHGQGYADLHFVIPETLKQVDVFKGPVLRRVRRLRHRGGHQLRSRSTPCRRTSSRRPAGAGAPSAISPSSRRRASGSRRLLAGEVYTTNGPFDRPQEYIRLNLFGKASASLSDSVDVSGWLSYLNSNWFASGQIPARAVREGLIDRFGAIDNSEGGNTQRLSANGDLRWQLSENETVRLHTYGQYYQLDLFSNFTFFLNDPDQRGRDRAVRSPPDRGGAGHVLRAARHALRDPREEHGGLSVPARQRPRGPVQRQGSEPARIGRRT